MSSSDQDMATTPGNSSLSNKRGPGCVADTPVGKGEFLDLLEQHSKEHTKTTATMVEQMVQAQHKSTQDLLTVFATKTEQQIAEQAEHNGRVQEQISEVEKRIRDIEKGFEESLAETTRRSEKKKI